mmetsp:Transcript_36292/g.26409  ORF Transcript_36292/g.26409 Transcript_36292/m.26409 type:complete len:88 (-) Transcript_36292:41-304(-)
MAGTLDKTHPLRLAIALNQGVFLYEHAMKLDEALHVCKIAFDDALVKLEFIAEGDYLDELIRVMKLIYDNIRSWTIDKDHEIKLNEL